MDVELDSIPREKQNYPLKRAAVPQKTLTIITLIVMSLVLTMQIVSFCYSIYINTNYSKKLDDLGKLTKNWEHVYLRVYPYTDQLGTLFSSVSVAKDLSVVMEDVKEIWPVIRNTMLQWNNFTLHANQFMGWSEQCIKGFGIC